MSVFHVTVGVKGGWLPWLRAAVAVPGLPQCRVGLGAAVTMTVTPVVSDLYRRVPPAASMSWRARATPRPCPSKILPSPTPTLLLTCRKLAKVGFRGMLPVPCVPMFSAVMPGRKRPGTTNSRDLWRILTTILPVFCRRHWTTTHGMCLDGYATAHTVQHLYYSP